MCLSVNFPKIVRIEHIQRQRSQNFRRWLSLTWQLVESLTLWRFVDVQLEVGDTQQSKPLRVVTLQLNINKLSQCQGFHQLPCQRLPTSEILTSSLAISCNVKSNSISSSTTSVQFSQSLESSHSNTKINLFLQLFSKPILFSKKTLQ